ncbi:Transcriptional repressor tup12-related protein [Histomonas meleagridis]|uniref:Transcriptional repressor tup12-related protein n=1 Tax=Histomonas meleagridis TaxID=135588 RepID=UPI003559BFEB|nr:Transcriptional repressor tup12-related protein [Histomonas meleagridis]KAH0805823.1 Transcriptional repressor tup12-related protein [Histomonas meleagridis]
MSGFNPNGYDPNFGVNGEQEQDPNRQDNPNRTNNGGRDLQTDQINYAYQILKRQLDTPEAFDFENPQKSLFSNFFKEPTYALHLTSIDWSIESNNAFFDNDSIKLRYALNSNTLVCAIAFNSTGDLFSFSNGRTLFILDSNDCSLILNYALPHYVKQIEMHTRVLKFSPDNKYIALNGSCYRILVYSLEENTFVGSLEGHYDVVSSILFTSDSKYMLTGGYDGVICVWSFPDFTLVKRIEYNMNEERQSIVSLALSNDDQYLFISFLSGAVGLCNSSFTVPMNTIIEYQDSLLRSSLSNNNKMIATASKDNTLKIWDIQDLVVCKQNLIGHTSFVVSCCFSPNDEYLFSGSKDESIKLWKQETGELLCTIHAHKNTVFQIEHHPRRNSFLTCGGDGILCMWDY